MFLGIDVGTSAAKAVVIDATGVLIAKGESPYLISRPHPGWSEQNPADWWAGVVSATRQACGALEPRAVKAVGLTGQMHGLVLIDRENLWKAGKEVVQPLRPAILWNDQRATAQCAAIEAALGGPAACVQALGNRALPGFTLPKALWVREHETELWGNAACMLLPKDYIRLLMTAETATDVGDASGMLMLNPATRRWSDEVSSAFDVDRRLLPAVRESGVITGDLTVWAADALGLPRSTPVVAGSGDNQCGAIGAGVVSPGEAQLSLGTSGVLYVHSDSPRFDISEHAPPGRTHTFLAADGAGGRTGEWCNTGCVLSAGGSLAWARDLLAPGVSFEALMDEAATAPPGSEGLAFLPHLAGERCPHPDPAARGAWVGLTTRHTRAHLIRAVLEGVALTMGHVMGLMRDMGVAASRARVVGGGAHSALWCQMHADTLGVPIVRLEGEGGPALGAAILAAVSSNAWTDVREACKVVIRERDAFAPRMGWALSDQADAFRNLYTATSPYFRAVSSPT